MKKRLFAIFLTLVMLVCVISLVPSAQTAQPNAQAQAQTGVLQAGYSKITITPTETGLPMSGYGTTTDRLSEGTMADDGLFATCVAITDQYNNTILYIGVDLINSSEDWTNQARKQIVEHLATNDYGIQTEDIFINASHTHSAPHINYGVSFTSDQLAADELAQKVKSYREWVYAQLSSAALSAMQDREPVTMTKGQVKASDALEALNPGKDENYYRMGYVRHYKNGDMVGGDNFGGSSFDYQNAEMVSDPVDTMHLVQFKPESGAPIVLVNWNAHGTLNSTKTSAYGTENHNLISADYVGSLRSSLESANYRVAFMQGAAGNIEPKTYTDKYKNPDLYQDRNINKSSTGDLYGAKLAQVALYALDEERMSDPLDTSYIRHASGSYTFNTNPPTDAEIAVINKLTVSNPSTLVLNISPYTNLYDYLVSSDANWAKRTTSLLSYTLGSEIYNNLQKFHSRYHLSSAKARMYWVGRDQSSLSASVIAIGTELSFVVSPCELFDRYGDSFTDNDWEDIIDNSTYGTPLIMGYTNGAMDYLPNAMCYSYNSSSTTQFPGSYETDSSRYGEGTGEGLVAFYDSMLDTVNTTEQKVQCECGGTVTSGSYGHVCEIREFMPWTRTDALPVSGYYYLTDNVTLTTQTPLESELHLDLNGFTITHQVSEAEGQKALDKKTDSTIIVNARVFYMGYTKHDAICTITDSKGGGKITRDLTNLTEDMKNAIDNYGLIVAMDASSTGSFTLYNGTLEATDQIAGGGACVANMGNTANKGTFRMYGGTLKGGRSGAGSCIYSSAYVELYGGTVTDGIDTGSSNRGAVFITADGKLQLSGNANVTENFKADGTTPSNISVDANNFTVKGTYSGTAGLNKNLQVGDIVGKSDNADITGSITGDQNTNDVYVYVSETNLVVGNTPMYASIKNNGTVTQYASFAEAIAQYPGGDAVIKLLKDNDEKVVFDQATKLDLAGFDLTGEITVTESLQVMDSETDDYTIENGNGYGVIPSNLSNVEAMEGYVKIPEADGISFHRLNLDFVGATVRPGCAGIYYQGQFGGDEVIRDHVVAYGTALGAGKEPGFEDRTFTSIELVDKETWECGIDENGRAKNIENGAILEDIMTDKYSYSVNRKNANIQVFSQSYVNLKIGDEIKRFPGECISFSFKELMQGTDRVPGVDDVFALENYLTEKQRTAILKLYETYKLNMSSWKLPNIKQAYADLNNAS